MSTLLLVSALLPIGYLAIAASSVNRFFNDPGQAQAYTVLRFRWHLLVSSLLMWLSGIGLTILDPPPTFGLVHLITFLLLFLAPISIVLSGGKMFTAVKEAKFLSDEDRSSQLSPDDPVIGLDLNGIAHAYPIKWMKQPQIVEDIIGGHPVIVTYSVHNKRAAAFSAEVKLHSLRLIFPPHREKNVMIYDASTKRLFQQTSGEIVFGPNKGEKIPTLPLRIVPWVTWESLHPESKVFYHEPKVSKPLPANNLIKRLKSFMIQRESTTFSSPA